MPDVNMQWIFVPRGGGGGGGEQLFLHENVPPMKIDQHGSEWKKYI